MTSAADLVAALRVAAQMVQRDGVALAPVFAWLESAQREREGVTDMLSRVAALAAE